MNLYVYDCDSGQGAVEAKSLEEAERKRHVHTCGYHTKYKTEVCPRCGKEDDEYTALTGRALFPFGWEFKK